MRLRNILIVTLLFAALAPAQTVSPSLYAGMRWRMIGPFRGGRALAVSGVPGRRDLYYFGAVGGGVWKTTNAGETWTPIFDSQPIASIGALAVAPSDPNVIYVGTGEADMRSDITFGNGVYKSTDAGQTWQHLGLDDTQQIGRILVDPRDPNLVLVAALGHAYGPNSERGVFRSTDGGRSWSKVLYKDENTGAADLAFDAEDPSIVYAALWNARRPPWSTYAPLQGPGSGLYKSIDGGLTWTQLTGGGLPDEQWGRAGIGTGKGRGINRVYVVLDQAKDGGLFRSDDRGATWSHVSVDARIRSRQWYFARVTVDPQNPDVVYLPNVALYRSSDGGKTFTPIKGAPGGDDYHDLWIDPQDPQRMATATDQGTVISVDGGRSWSSWYNQPTAQMYHVATDNQFPYYVYGAQQDSGTVATVSRSDYGSITFRDWFSVGAGEAGYIAPDPSDPNTVYGGDTYGRLHRFDRRTGQSLDISPTAVAQWGEEINQRKLRFTWTSPVVFSPQDPHALYMGAQYVLKTTDRGNSWQAISPDLTGCDASDVVRSSVPAEGGRATSGRATSEALSASNAVVRCFGVVYTIAPSPLDANVIWAGTDTGRIWLTRDGGKTWNNVSAPGLADWSKISMIEGSRFDAGTAYVAVDRHRLDDYAPHIYRTHDFGKTWEKSPPGRVGAYIRAIREDPKRKGLLYAATELGVYVSFDDGDHWQPLQLNLPVAPVHDLVVHGDDLVIATHGRSFWILDDVTPLRQITPEVAKSDAYLFQPQVAMRVRSDQQHDTPLPPELPAGQNPPAGAIINYFLSAPASEVTLEILDAAGHVVRRYSSLDQPPTHEPVAIAESWFVPPPKLEAGAGGHRFTWDLRYASPPATSRSYGLAAVYGVPMAATPRGPMALPDQYQVRLTANGKTYTQPLTLKPDPRVQASAADLQMQFDLEMQIVGAMQQAWDALQKRGGAPTTDAARTGAQRNPLAATLSSLGSLLSVVDTADAAPTQQAQEAYKELRLRLDQLLR